MKLKGNVAIITGATGDIGQAICKKLADEQANIVINYFDQEEEEKANELKKDLINRGVKSITVKADVSSFTDVERMFEETIETFGKIDILVNNAGITLDGVVTEIPVGNFRKVLDVNLVGPFITSKFAVKYMSENNYGRIINISSIAGIIGLRGSSAYAASKSGLFGLSKSIAREVARKGITVNVICPGYINGGLMKLVDKNYLNSMLQNQPMKQIGTPKDIANGVYFLSLPDSQYITGELIRIDGGLAM